MDLCNRLGLILPLHQSEKTIEQKTQQKYYPITYISRQLAYNMQQIYAADDSSRQFFSDAILAVTLKGL